MRASRTAATLLAAIVLTAQVAAHRLDEYLQSARIGVEPDRVDVELSLTPGVAVVDRIVAEIDRDQDGLLSAAEKDAYTSSVMRAVAVTIDGELLETQVVDMTFPSVEVLRRGGGIRIGARAALPAMSAGVHHLGFSNAHRRDVSVYLANALVPASDRVAVRAQHRDEAQHELIIEYVLRAEAPAAAFIWLMGVSAVVIGLFTALRARAAGEASVIP